MKYLKELDCTNCQIKSVNLSKNPNLKTVYWYQNNTEVFQLGSNKKLAKLNCYLNKIKSIDVSLCTNLSILQVGQNKITSLDVSQNTELTYLSCEMKSFQFFAMKKGIAVLTFRNC